MARSVRSTIVNGSSAQARAVNDGLDADVVTMNTTTDVDFLASTGVVAKDWNKRFAHNAAPTTSTMLFLTRNGNPKNIKDWGDLVQDGVQIVTPNPKTSGGARWNYLAAWRWAEKEFKGDQAKIKEFIKKLYSNAPVLDTGATGSTITFVKRKIGDVYLAWENEAHLIAEEFPGQTEIVVPPSSIAAEPSVAVVKRNAIKNGTEDLAEAYLKFWYTPEAQELAAKNYFRPRDKTIAAKYASQFPDLELVDIKHFGGWAEAQKKHFDDGGIYDEIFKR